MMNLLEMLETADILGNDDRGLPGIENAPQGTMPADYTLVYARCSLPSSYIISRRIIPPTPIYSQFFTLYHPSPISSFSLLRVIK